MIKRLLLIAGTIFALALCDPIGGAPALVSNVPDGPRGTEGNGPGMTPSSPAGISAAGL